MIAPIMTEPTIARSCFIDFADLPAACTALVTLETEPVVPYWVHGISRHDEGAKPFSVFFTLHCDGDTEQERTFIERAEALGGTYSGS